MSVPCDPGSDWAPVNRLILARVGRRVKVSKGDSRRRVGFRGQPEVT